MNGPIALTGATGFVGRRVLALAAKGGVHVRAMARRPAALDDVRNPTLEVVEGDLLDDGAPDRLVAGAASIIHCAGAIAGPPDTLALVNVEGTRRLATAARQAGTARLVHVSSLAAREPGLSGYALSKRLGEREIIDGLPRERWAMVRPPVVYGPGDPATLPLMAQLARSTAWLPGSRRQRFSLIHADDLARALLHLAQAAPHACGAIFHLHDGRTDGYTWADVAAAATAAEGRPRRVHHLPRLLLAAVARLSYGWTRLTGRQPGPLSPGKVRELYHRDWVCRRALLEDATGWRPEVGFEDGFARTLGWYRDNGWLPPASGVAKTLADTDQGVRPG